ncbi:bromodomain-containing protein 7 isoform X2 [Latimeria chalumnae]|uniref:bromodomain-containing protein 7 isoform X2 n=1 Tax=Latimeria chalumnae TaxID=7897 RepID=UPI0006D90DC7|nr:PREDICTED: bromodomain-containing protein 7 isoform X2 [Latimeria chalumnae]|eukprot:XP_014344060.1 PREDICTED: bromodomain-containing protein 7 isoform X2 [Latimeria chalumnae]
MGKKHKKHKSEKHSYEDYEKPLKLVLKVGGSEVTELSAGSSGLDSSFHEEKLDHDKHKDKKKKKKKKGEKEKHPSDDEKKRKKDDKKKRGPSEILGMKEERSQTPVRIEILPEKPIGTPSAKSEEKEQTPLQEALTQLIRQLQRKDPTAFFSFPVTDFIAPGYSIIIKRPMDFSTMKEKVKRTEYQSVEELKDDFKLMCENAMKYNKPETIYYKAAKKLLHSGMKILSQERIQSLKQSIEFMADLEKSRKTKERMEAESHGSAKKEELKQKEEPMETSEKCVKNTSKENKRKDRDLKEAKSKVENSVDKELEQINRVIQESGGKLTKREINSKFDFKRRKSDGTTTLGVLNPVDPSAGEPGYCPVKLGMMTRRLQSGVNTLQGFKEDKRNKVTPVSYVNYGPFSSYAPVYDSTFANVSKEDSDLIFMTYGEESSLQESFSLQDASLDDYTFSMADHLLDALTNGQHSKALKQQDAVIETDTASRLDASSSKGRFASLSSVAALEAEPPACGSEESGKFQKKLDETTRLLWELQEAQNERLSTKPSLNVICLLGPSIKEMQLAEKVTNNLKELASQVTPGDISSIDGIRKAMGISIPFQEVEENLMDLITDSDAPRPDLMDLTEEPTPVAS